MLCSLHVHVFDVTSYFYSKWMRFIHNKNANEKSAQHGKAEEISRMNKNVEFLRVRMTKKEKCSPSSGGRLVWLNLRIIARHNEWEGKLLSEAEGVESYASEWKFTPNYNDVWLI